MYISSMAYTIRYVKHIIIAKNVGERHYLLFKNSDVNTKILEY